MRACGEVLSVQRVRGTRALSAACVREIRSGIEMAANPRGKSRTQRKIAAHSFAEHTAGRSDAGEFPDGGDLHV